MRVLFCNAPWHAFPDGDSAGFRGIRAGSRWPHTIPYYGGALVGNYLPFPFFLATVHALAVKEGFTSRVRDSVALGESYEQFYAAVDDFAPDVVVLETATPSIVNDLEVARRLVREGRVLVMTGIHGELEQSEFLRREWAIDYVIYGEYERPCVDLLHALASGDRTQLHQVSSLLYRVGDLVMKNPAEALPPLDELPWPERDQLPAANYFDQAGGLERPQLQINTTRGCPYGCIFCVWPQMVYRGHSYRRREPKDVVDEIAANLTKVSYSSFYVDDDTFNIDRRHVLAFARELQARSLTYLPWGAMCRADLMDEEILSELKAAGIHTVKYGVESADQAVLDAIDKRIQIDKIVDNVALTKAFGIRVHLTFTFGHPSDTEESIEKTIELAAELPADSVQFSIATPFPGTKMYDLFRERGWLVAQDWECFDGSGKAVARTDTLTQEQLEGYVKLGYRRREAVRVQKHILDSAGFRQALAARLATRRSSQAPVLVVHSAPVQLTRALVRVTAETGLEVHLLAHRRFADDLRDAGAECLHLFENTGDFWYAPLRELAQSLRERYRLAGAVIPYNNAYGTGYEEVMRVAREAAGDLLIGVTMDGVIRAG